MAVIRCPACHKPNPDFLEICQYCDAPLRGEAPSAAPQSATEQDTIRCQACGKSNPSLLEVCQYCEARLKPLVAVPPSDVPAAAPPVGDALARLRASVTPIEEEPEPEETAEAAPAPDWMNRLQAEAASAQTPAQNEPDWMWGGAGATETTDDPSTGSGQAGKLTEDTPDWL